MHRDGFDGYVRRSGGERERLGGAYEACGVYGTALPLCDFLEICKVLLRIDIDYEFGEGRDSICDP